MGQQWRGAAIRALHVTFNRNGVVTPTVLLDMFAEMTEAQLVLLLGSIGNALLTGWNAFVLYKDRRDKRAHQEKLELLTKDREEKLELLMKAREDKEREHRHRMAEIQQMQMFELEKMSRAVHDAKVVAVETKRDISKKIDEAKVDRNARMDKLEDKMDDNTQKTEKGIDAANHVAEKFEILRLANLAAAGTNLAAKSVELQKEGNEKLEEIAENTAPAEKK